MSVIYLTDAMCILSGPVTIPEIPGLGLVLPANAVVLGELPEPRAGHVWVWRDGEAVELADHRGTYYRTDTGERVEHAELGDLPDGLAREPRPSPHHAWQDGAWVLPRDDVERIAWERIKAERERRTLSGGARVGEYWFHTDQLSRDQQMKLMLAGEDVPRIGWKSMSGEYVQMTPELARAIVEAVGAADIAIFAAADAHRGAMLASDDPAAYDFSHGWPMTYDEWAAQQEA